MADEADLALNLSVYPVSAIPTAPANMWPMFLNNDPFGGEYVVSGVVMAADHVVPGAEVYLADGITGVKAYKTIANSQGGFEFQNVRKGPWTIYGVDPTATFNGDIYTHVLGVSGG